MVAEWFRACVKFKKTLTRKLRLDSRSVQQYLLYILTSVWVLRTPNAGRNSHFQRINGLPQTSYTCTHAVTPCSSKSKPCTAQVAGHTSNKTWPAQMRETSATILAAYHFGALWLCLMVNDIWLSSFGQRTLPRLIFLV